MPTSRNGTILVVDDEEIMRDILETLVQLLLSLEDLLHVLLLREFLRLLGDVGRFHLPHLVRRLIELLL